MTSFAPKIVLDAPVHKYETALENALEARLDRLEHMGLEELRRFWALHYGPPLGLRSTSLLRTLIAWRLQTGALGKLSPDLKKALRKKGAVKSEGHELGVGAKLTRIWLGRKIDVVVEEDGFSWEGRRYKSLSAVARAITGSRWNGPRFFGLRAQ